MVYSGVPLISILLGFTFLILSPYYIARGIILGVWNIITGNDDAEDELEKVAHGIIFLFMSMVVVLPGLIIIGLVVAGYLFLRHLIPLVF